jgi:hypothetical protein
MHVAAEMDSFDAAFQNARDRSVAVIHYIRTNRQRCASATRHRDGSHKRVLDETPSQSAAAPASEQAHMRSAWRVPVHNPMVKSPGCGGLTTARRSALSSPDRDIVLKAPKRPLVPGPPGHR